MDEMCPRETPERGGARKWAGDYEGTSMSPENYIHLDLVYFLSIITVEGQRFDLNQSSTSHQVDFSQSLRGLRGDFDFGDEASFFGELCSA